MGTAGDPNSPVSASPNPGCRNDLLEQLWIFRCCAGLVSATFSSGRETSSTSRQGNVRMAVGICFPPSALPFLEAQGSKRCSSPEDGLCLARNLPALAAESLSISVGFLVATSRRQPSSQEKAIPGITEAQQYLCSTLLGHSAK